MLSFAAVVPALFGKIVDSSSIRFGFCAETMLCSADTFCTRYNTLQVNIYLYIFCFFFSRRTIKCMSMCVNSSRWCAHGSRTIQYTCAPTFWYATQMWISRNTYDFVCHIFTISNNFTVFVSFFLCCHLFLPRAWEHEPWQYIVRNAASIPFGMNDRQEGPLGKRIYCIRHWHHLTLSSLSVWNRIRNDV